MGKVGLQGYTCFIVQSVIKIDGYHTMYIC